MAILLWVSRVSPLVAAIVCAILGGAVFFSTGSRGKKHVLFLVFSLILTIWALACFVQSVTTDPAAALFFDSVLYSAAVFAPTIFLSFVSLLTNKKRGLLLLISYSISCALFAANLSPFFRNGVVLLFRNRYVTNPAAGWYAYLLFFSAVIAIGFYDLIVSIIRTAGKTRNHLKYIFLANMMLVIGGGSYFALILNLAKFPYDSILNLISSTVLVIYEIILAYAITKHELMDIRLIINRTAAWLITVTILGGVYFSLAGLYLTYISPRISLLFLILSTIYGILVGETFLKIRLFLQRTADQAFIKDWYDYPLVSEKIAFAFRQATSIGDIVKNIYPVLKENVHIKDIHFFFQDNDAGGFVKWDPVSLEPDRTTLIKKDDGLVSRMLLQKDIVPMEKDRRLKGVLAVPSLAGQGLISFLILEQKDSEDPYTEEDKKLLRMVGEYIAIALEYVIKPYETIKKDFEANQKKLYDTDRLLARSEKIAALANLIQEYNHELKTPLAIIKGETERLIKAPRDAAYLEWFAKLVLKHAARADDIVESTLRLSQPKQRQEAELDLNGIIEEALRIFPPNGVHLVKEFQPLPKMMGDKDDLVSLFVNLIKNAVEAMPQGGDLKISTFPGAEDGEPVVRAEVADTGTGIPKENMERIFEPFFSTHVTKGRGLGLSVSYRIVRDHLGGIDVKSEVGAGSTFKVQFRAKKN